MFSLKKILLILLLFAVGLFFLLRHYFKDIQVNKYPDMQVVKQENAIDRGWIPAILPDSAYNIAETHNLDTNEVFGTFYYKKSDEASFMKLLQHAPDMNRTYIWKDFLFKVDKETQKVKYRNRPVER